MDRRKVEIDLSIIDADSVNRAVGNIVSKLASAERHALGLKRALDEAGVSRGRGGAAGGITAAGSASLQRQAMADAARLARLRESLQAQEKRAEVRETRLAEALKRRELARTERQRLAAERRVEKESRRAEAAKMREVRARERLASIDRRNAVGSARREAALDRRHSSAAAGIFAREQARGDRFRARADRLSARETESRGRLLWGGAMSPVRGLAGVAGSAGRIVTGGLALGGAAGLYDIVHKSIAVEGQAGDIENLTNGKYSSGQIMALAAASGKQTGLSSRDILSGLNEFIAKTGDADTGMRNVPTFARVARATGASVSDIASTAADLSSKFGLKSVTDMTDALGMLTQQGKDGSFELRDMAKQFPKIGAAASNYGLSGILGVRQLGGFAQIARRGVGNSEQASTSVEQFFNQIAKKSSKLEAGDFGEKFSIYNKFGDRYSGSKDLFTLIPGLIDSVQGDMGSMIKILDARGNRAVTTLLKLYNDGFASAKGTTAQRRSAGMAAVRGELERTMLAQGDSAMLNRDFERRMEKTDAKLGQATEQLTAEIGQRLLPVIAEAAPKFAEMIPKLVSLTERLVEVAPGILEFTTGLTELGLTAAGWAADNPVQAALLAVAAGIGKAALGQWLGNLGSGLLGKVTTGGIAGNVAASAGAAAMATGGGGRLAGALKGLPLIGAGIVAATFAADAYADNSRAEETPQSVRLARALRGAKGSQLGEIKAELSSRTGGFSLQTREAIASYLGVRGAAQTMGLFGERIDDVDRAKMISTIEGIQSGRAVQGAVSPPSGTSNPLTESQWMEFGFNPAAMGVNYTPDVEKATSEPDPSVTLNEASTGLVDAALALRESAESTRDAAQQIRDSLAQKGVFR